jgi:hypothetical protein
MSKKKGPLSKIKSIRKLKTEAIALFVFSGAIFGIFIGIGGPNALVRPQVTTMFLHYNLQYRAGLEEIEINILNDSLREMVGMFDRHPNWKYTIEIQSYAIERLMNEKEKFPGILSMLQSQNKRGQMELICGVYSSQILNAYPSDPLNHSVRLTSEILEKANLTASRAMLFQEGQYAPGLSYYLNESGWAGTDTVIISEQQLMDFWPTGQEEPPSDVPLYISRLGNKKSYILRYDYAPRYEGGYYHGWNYWSDAELAIEKNGVPSLEEFTVDHDRLKDFELYYENLERHGNVFMTIEEWINHCLAEGYYRELNHYQMSTHWGPTKYDTCFIWFGDPSGSVDDGDMLASNYRGRNILNATYTLNQTYGNLLSDANRALVKTLLDQATRALLLSMVTDTTGINPRDYEREYGYSNVQKVFQNCSEVVKIFVDNIPALAGATKLQVDFASGQISTTPTDLVTYSGDQTLVSLNKLLPLDIVPHTTGKTPAISVKNATFLAQDLIELNVNFEGDKDWSKNGADIDIEFKGDLNQLVYCPPLAGHLTVRVNRTDYLKEDILNLHLPISNGLFFIPKSKGSDVGMALIHNASQYLLAPLWNTDKLTYKTGEITMNASMQFFILPNTTISQAQSLANRINNRVSWIIAPNITNMQGFEFLDAYYQTYRTGQTIVEDWW